MQPAKTALIENLFFRIARPESPGSHAVLLRRRTLRRAKPPARNPQQSHNGHYAAILPSFAPNEVDPARGGSNAAATAFRASMVLTSADGERRRSGADCLRGEGETRDIEGGATPNARSSGSSTRSSISAGRAPGCCSARAGADLPWPALFHAVSGASNAIEDLGSQRLSVKAHTRLVAALAILVRRQNVAHPLIRQPPDRHAGGSG